MGCYGHKLSNGVLFAYHLILGVPGGSSHLAYRRRVGISHNPGTRVKAKIPYGMRHFVEDAQNKSAERLIASLAGTADMLGQDHAGILEARVKKLRGESRDYAAVSQCWWGYVSRYHAAARCHTAGFKPVQR